MDPPAQHAADRDDGEAASLLPQSEQLSDVQLHSDAEDGDDSPAAAGHQGQQPPMADSNGAAAAAAADSAAGSAHARGDSAAPPAHAEGRAAPSQPAASAPAAAPAAVAATAAAASPQSVMADPSGIAAAPAPTEPDAGAEGDDNEAQTLLPRRADSAAAPGSDDSRLGAGRAAGGAGAGGGSASDSDSDSVFLDSPVAGRRPGSVGAAATNPYWQIDGAMRNPLAGQPPLETPSSRHHQVCKPGNNQNPVAPWCAVRYTVQARQRCVLLHHTPLLSGDTARSCLVQQVQDRPCASC